LIKISIAKEETLFPYSFIIQLKRPYFNSPMQSVLSIRPAFDYLISVARKPRAACLKFLTSYRPTQQGVGAYCLF